VAGTVALLVGIPAGWQWMENRRLERELADARTASAHRDDAPVVPVLMASPEWPELSLARPGALSASIRQAPNPLASTLAALWAVDSRIDTQTRLSLLRTRLGLDATQTAAVSDALDDMQRDQQTLVRSITEGDVQFENVMQFLRAEDRAEARIRAVLNAEQVAPFTELQEERFEALLGTLVDWRVRDLDALLPLREDQIEGVRAALLQNGREHRGILTAPDVTDFQQLLAKLSAEGRAEAEKLSRLLTPEQMKKYEDQSRSRGAALDRLLQPNHAPK
jgi:PAS domain-containing protein